MCHKTNSDLQIAPSACHNETIFLLPVKSLSIRFGDCTGRENFLGGGVGFDGKGTTKEKI